MSHFHTSENSKEETLLSHVNKAELVRWTLLETRNGCYCSDEVKPPKIVCSDLITCGCSFAMLLSGLLAVCTAFLVVALYIDALTMIIVFSVSNFLVCSILSRLLFGWLVWVIDIVRKQNDADYKPYLALRRIQVRLSPDNDEIVVIDLPKYNADGSAPDEDSPSYLQLGRVVDYLSIRQVSKQSDFVISDVAGFECKHFCKVEMSCLCFRKQCDQFVVVPRDEQVKKLVGAKSVELETFRIIETPIETASPSRRQHAIKMRIAEINLMLGTDELQSIDAFQMTLDAKSPIHASSAQSAQSAQSGESRENAKSEENGNTQKTGGIGETAETGEDEEDELGILDITNTNTPVLSVGTLSQSSEDSVEKRSNDNGGEEPDLVDGVFTATTRVTILDVLDSV